MLGSSWNMRGYLIAGAVALWGPKLLSRFVNAKQFRMGAVDLLVEKAVWTEGIARSDWAQGQFGNVAYDPRYGQMYVQQGDQWDAMQGLVEASSLDGLVEASSLDAGDGYAYGHLMPASAASPEEVRYGRNTGVGYTDRFHAAFA